MILESDENTIVTAEELPPPKRRMPVVSPDLPSGSIVFMPAERTILVHVIFIDKSNGR